MAEAEEKKKKSGPLGLGDLLRNKAALFALGSGFTAASRGGDFSQGAGYGLNTYQNMEGARLNRELQEMQHAQATQSQKQREMFRQSLPEDQRMLFDVAPKEYAKSQLATEKTTTKQRDYEHAKELFERQGMPPKEAANAAFNAIYAKKSMRIRSTPDGGFELVESWGDEAAFQTPKLAAEARGRYAAGLPNVAEANENLRRMEEGGYNPNRDKFAYALRGLEESPLVRLTFPGLGSYAAKVAGGDDYQTYEQNAKAFEATVLPILSGAAVTPTEAARMIAASLPEPGDSEARLKSKRIYRQTLIEAANTLLTGGEYDIDAIRARAREIEQMGGEGEQTQEGEPGWSEEKEKRYQELKRKLQEGASQ